MTEYTQLQLLDEGVWDTFKKSAVGRGIGTIAKTGFKVVKTALPELTAPFEQAYNAGAGVVNTAANAWRSPVTKIIKALTDRGMQIIGNPIPSGKNYIVNADRIVDYDKNNKAVLSGHPIRIIVDENGNTVNSLRNAPRGAPRGTS